ncbi:hypothetical protein GH714_005198 [Hevea brasiliensis]|uniref:Uncharacterized protein n=1 Tax=Hevea brasiliensis TaxID=3981 RepID=A0A6A6M982_HEVBR|nr:hypothetical protein GH714_005198 [Hevea brasiliensis]
MEREVLIASSSIDGGIGCWDLQTGAELLRYKFCASTPHGLTCVGRSFLASSQLRDPHASSGSIHYWSWTKPQVEVKSFPEEPIKPLVANSEGAYIVGGGLSGHIYLWEVATGRLLKKWRAHYREVTCLVFTKDDSFLVSGAEDGSVRVWSLLMIFDDYQTEQSSHLYEHSFLGTTSPVTDIVTGYGGGRAIIIAASEDRTCPVNNIQIVRWPLYLNPPVSLNVQASSRRHGSLLPPPLDKYVNSTDKNTGINAVIRLQSSYNGPPDASYLSCQVIDNQIKELKQQGSAAAAEMEVERLKLDCTHYTQMLQKWKKMYDNLHELCVNEILEGDNEGQANCIEQRKNKTQKSSNHNGTSEKLRAICEDCVNSNIYGPRTY